MEYREVQAVQIFDKRLLMKDKSGATITYAPWGTQLVRRVNGSGYEILLQNVKAVTYETAPGKLVIRVQDLDGKLHEGIVTRPAVLEEGA